MYWGALLTDYKQVLTVSGEHPFSDSAPEAH